MEFVEVRSFVDLPPRYAEWATGENLPMLPAIIDAVTIPGPDGSRIITRLTITAPENQLRLLRDPETPAENATLALKVTVDPPAPQLLWYVDGQPYQLVEYPYTARWIANSGEHEFQARLPNSPIASTPICVIVQ